MDLLTTMYLILGCISVFTVIIILAVIAGKEIMFAFFRRFNRRGCDIFVIDSNKQVNHYFKTPKDGVFNLPSGKYITNPNKLLSLDDQAQTEVRLKLDVGKKKLEKNIAKLVLKKEFIIKQMRGLKDIPDNLTILQNLQLQNTEMDNKIELLNGKLVKKEHSYFMNRRSAYLYVENDPVPKDLFEFYTELDNIQIENIIVRAQTKDPKNFGEIEKSILLIKKIAVVTLIIVVIAAYFAFMNKSAIDQLAAASGVVLTV